MRWRTIDEVKVGKGEKICANIACDRSNDLEGMELVFGYVEDGKRKEVLVKCVLCAKCGRKMKKAKGREESKKRKRSVERFHHRSFHDRKSGRDDMPVENDVTRDLDTKLESHPRRRSENRRAETSRYDRNKESEHRKHSHSSRSGNRSQDYKDRRYSNQNTYDP